MSRISGVLLIAIVLSACCAAQSPLDQIWKKATTPASEPSTTPNQPAAHLGTDKITAGLKEALKVGTTKAVAATGKPDGFLKNEAIKILLPDQLRTAGKGMRLMGMGPQLDDLEIGMNRAAEQAAPQAKQIFLNALMAMSIADARQILSGNDTAATDYFRGKSSADLTTAFKPIVHRSMQNVGLIKQFNQVMQSSMAGPLLQSKSFDLDNYVVGKTLDGLFYMLGQQEKQIRKNPAAQTTNLLKEVFGNRVPSGAAR